MNIAIGMIFVLLLTNIFTVYCLYKLNVKFVEQKSQLYRAIYRQNLYKALFKETLPPKYLKETYDREKKGEIKCLHS